MKAENEKSINEEKNSSQEHNSEVISNIRNLLENQPFCVLCTQGEGQPYGSLIAFAYTDDLKRFFFITPNTTRKYTLLEKCSNISLLVDTRSENPEQMKQVEAVTVTGVAHELESGPNYKQGLQMLKDRHPYMSDFQQAESTALFGINVKRYLYVTRFQEVTQWTP